ncbi:hypothetical protein IWQ61_005817 [Dispira simplex]|nr:hypothetical protein IWQ61_005817 [Dispira simplex]
MPKPFESSSPSSVVPEPPSYSMAAPVPNHDPTFIQQHYPSFLQLRLVQILHRHGERTPERRRFTPVAPQVWNLCQHGNQFHQQFVKVLERYTFRDGNIQPSEFANEAERNEAVPLRPSPEQPVTTVPWFQERVFSQNRGDKVPSHKDLSQDPITSATCAYGQLTDVGRASLTRLGMALRNIYVDQLGFLPGLYTNSRQFYLRCSEYSRTFESIHQLISGLYPIPAKSTVTSELATLASRSQPPFNVFIRAPTQETLFADFTCKRLMELLKQVSKDAWQPMHLEWEQFLQDRIYPTAIGDSIAQYLKSTPRRMNTHHVYDVLVAMRAHNIPLPRGITEDTMVKLEEITACEWTLGMKQNLPYLRLLTGRVVEELVTQIKDKIHYEASNRAGKPYTVPLGRTYSPADLKFTVLSAHDSTLLPMLTMINPSHTEWPAFAAHITLELFHDPTLAPSQLATLREVGERTLEKGPSDVPPLALHHIDLDPEEHAGYFVRVRYNDQFLTLPQCTPSDHHHPKMGPTMCTFASFYDTVRRAIPNNYREECQPMGKTLHSKKPPKGIDPTR